MHVRKSRSNRQAPHSVFHGGTNVKELHVEEDLLAEFCFNSLASARPPSVSDAQPDLIKDSIAELLCQFNSSIEHPLQRSGGHRRGGWSF